MQIDRRSLLAGGATGALAIMAGCSGRAEATEGGVFPVRYSEAQWRERLTPAEFRILRGHGTERPFSSPLDDEHRRGTFICAGCNNRLFSSATKFDSGTGWPSFYRPLAGGVGTTVDTSLGMTRTEVHCADCGGHLGHVFRDGPRPTGLRYCMNGTAMDFVPARS
ncbi:peptide-methionine (R)-S-oxide reductase MsrB [Parasphingopyxis lamellibrachiae]|uniref:peptide-methionine (R)-S-oxide reductase n=1 Tax=Parasphingopyxis lamellibrachiae TaxID=680125 RepID=A0A3D9FI38_9SPHN|nr:peptide-methionine (R)-S-oxide reductase MsrB [Parasphingopyxis lamellibrachiae]RED17445.1 peptide-methionine (R)-S-oxide reductase [Parasphingopyxis lamellibrachiae]